jgi:heterodisulfide reductase subunit C
LEIREVVSSREVIEGILTEEKLNYCQDCGTCTASCPLARVIPDVYKPRNILQRVYLDFEELIKGEELWLCAWCYRCTERCPQEIEPTEIFLMARNFAVDAGNIPAKAKRIIIEIINSGRSMPHEEFIDDLREDYGLPPVGKISEKVLREQNKIMGKEFMGRLENG